MGGACASSRVGGSAAGCCGKATRPDRIAIYGVGDLAARARQRRVKGSSAVAVVGDAGAGEGAAGGFTAGQGICCIIVGAVNDTEAEEREYRYLEFVARGCSRVGARVIAGHYTSDHITICQSGIGVGSTVGAYVITVLFPLISRSSTAVGWGCGKGDYIAFTDTVAGIGGDGDGGCTILIYHNVRWCTTSRGVRTSSIESIGTRSIGIWKT